MTEADIKQIETALGVSLPPFYTATMRGYPFPQGSSADELMLVTKLDDVLRENSHPGNYPGIAEPFIIGSDGGEEVYLIDLAASQSQVFVYDVEKGAHSVKANTWPEYLGQVQAVLDEIAADKRAQAERKANKKWWELWK
jgi:cell wall assembly regulator SMI1